MTLSNTKRNGSKKTGILIGGSGLIGGTLMHYFKTKVTQNIDIRTPNSKKLSLREPKDIKLYFERVRPDFIINSAIVTIGSNHQLAYEVNYMGVIHLARAAVSLGIPYIHISSAATLPFGENITEQERLPLTADLSNYAKSKLMAELTLKRMHEDMGLDYTNIRLAVVYGAHDHKIQGFNRLLFSIANGAKHFMLTKKGTLHSYSNSKKMPYFVHHALMHRQEFSGKTYNFVDHAPIDLAQLILTIKSYLDLSRPKEIYVPYGLARMGKGWLNFLVRILNNMGIEARMPAELMFMESFYKTQTLSPAKFEQSSFVDPAPNTTIFTELPMLIQYYLTRWAQLNLIRPYNDDFFDPNKKIDEFMQSPEKLLEYMHQENLSWKTTGNLEKSGFRPNSSLQ